MIDQLLFIFITIW